MQKPRDFIVLIVKVMKNPQPLITNIPYKKAYTLGTPKCEGLRGCLEFGGRDYLDPPFFGPPK